MTHRFLAAPRRTIREAIALCLETQPQEGWSLPPEYQVVDVEIAAA
jgi:hypothetical protein